ncbi:MAG: carboxymuconolactone decarboxylase family protein [Pseudomonadota bacterium]
MSRFTPHTLATVPENGQALLKQVSENYGFIPNLIGTMVESPEAAEAYLAIGDLFAKTGFTATEQQIVLLTISRINDCSYCMAAHSTIAAMQKVPEDVVAAIRNDRPIDDPRLEALRRFAAAVAEQRGWVSDEQVEAFLAAGFERRRVLDVVLGATLKTLSNYTNHIADTEVDPAFAPQRWTPPATQVA